MKQKLFATLILLLLASPAHAVVTYNCDALTGGAARAVDYMSVSDLNDGDRAIAVVESGSSTYYYYFKYDASGTTAETVAAHPYHVRPDDYATAGVWVEVSVSWVDLAATTMASLTNLTVTGTFTVNKVEASGALSGSLPITDLADATTHTLSGVSVEGGIAHNYYAIGGSGTTIHIADGNKGDSFIASLARSTQVGSGSGASMWITWANSQSLLNQTIFQTGTGGGTSAYQMSGTTGMGLTAICISDDLWYVYEDGSPTQESN